MGIGSEISALPRGALRSFGIISHGR
jgi:hypothetical protein